MWNPHECIIYIPLRTIYLILGRYDCIVLCTQNPFASMKREKTALDVTVSDKEKQDTYTKLMREQTAVLQHKQESQRKQEEMVSQTLPTVIQTWSYFLLDGYQNSHQINHTFNEYFNFKLLFTKINPTYCSFKHLDILFIKSINMF